MTVADPERLSDTGLLLGVAHDLVRVLVSDDVEELELLADPRVVRVVRIDELLHHLLLHVVFILFFNAEILFVVATTAFFFPHLLLVCLEQLLSLSIVDLIAASSEGLGDECLIKLLGHLDISLLRCLLFVCLLGCQSAGLVDVH